MPLLWAIRDIAGLTGTKYGCGVSQCGACTVQVEGEPVRACALAVGEAKGKKVVTIEGLASKPAKAVQTAWQKLDVPQCGYCQTGMIMAAAALIAEKPTPTDEDINAEITNICRCGTYNRVRAAIKLAAGVSRG
jgi:isoquinoline 1-oxidoreductase alpha subunit